MFFTPRVDARVYMTDEESELYLRTIIAAEIPYIRRLYHRCLRVGRKIGIEFVYRAIVTSYFEWLNAHRDGFLADFLLNCSVRDIYAGFFRSIRSQQVAYAHTFSTALH